MVLLLLAEGRATLLAEVGGWAMSAGDVRGWAASAARLQDGALDVGDRLLRHHYVVVAATITAGGVVSDEGQTDGRGGGDVSDEGDRGATARQGGEASA